MAWSGLSPNQMADEANAVTGGFTAIGTKLSPTNKCYTKAEALAAYQLSSSAMSAYANNQLVPKEVWVATESCITPAYLGVNCLGGDASTFSVARTTGNISASTSFNLGAVQAGIGLYQVRRAYFGFNTTSITTATAINLKFTLNQSVIVASPTRLVVVRPASTLAATHPWVLADYPISNGGTIVSNIVTLNQSQVGEVLFQLNATGVSYVNANNDTNFIIVEYDRDYLNVAPIPVEGVVIAGNNSSVRLCVVS